MALFATLEYNFAYLFMILPSHTFFTVNISSNKKVQALTWLTSMSLKQHLEAFLLFKSLLHCLMVIFKLKNELLSSIIQLQNVRDLFLTCSSKTIHI